ncbi:MAG: AAA family ATPase [Deltaproteobacteria bacterium]|jgi:type II secretory pathway predicted ATPase ExeA|nr:AAA family ATPase [Deltaproteobacteria bacterium]
MDYESFFNLREKPFKNSLSYRFFFRGPAFARLLELLRADAKPPLLFLTGAQGVGKTSALLSLAPALAGAGSTVAYARRGDLPLSGILQEALRSLKLSRLLDPEAPEETLLGYFQDAVSELIERGQSFVLAIDDAQNLSRETRADVFALTSLEESWLGKTTLLLGGRLSEGYPLETVPPDAEILELKPFGPREVSQYVAFRLKAGGARSQPFGAEALAALYGYSGGLPGPLNGLAERSLLTAWAAGKKEVALSHVSQAKTTLDNPMSINAAALAKAKGDRGPKRQRAPRPARPLLALMCLIAILGLLGGWFFHWPGKADLTAGETASPRQASPATDAAAPMGPTLTPAAAPSLPLENANLALPSPPPALLSLPRNSLALVVDQNLNMARLWQGSLKGPGLKAEIAPPEEISPGLYLVGRPQSRSALIFQYPPSQELPRRASSSLWKQVETILPQDILPLVVGDGPSLAKPVPPDLGKFLRDKLRQWSQNQEYKFADRVSALYDAEFRFFQPGARDLTITRDKFAVALKSELRTSGDVKLTMSEPLLLLDPRDHKRAWAVFNLKYDSNLRHDMGLRTLIFEKASRKADWLIVAELWIKEIPLRD